MAVEIVIEGLDKAKFIVNEVAGEQVRVNILDDVGAVMLNRTRTRYLRQEAPDGTIWKESQAARDRAASGRDGKTLFDTGALFHSIRLSGGEGASRFQRSISTDVGYGAYHQEGRGQVERVFIGMSQPDSVLIDGIILRRIQEVANNA